MNKNIVEIQIGDQKIGFKFCFASYSIFCEMHQISFTQLVDYTKQIDLMKIRDLLYSGHKAYCQSKGIECEITPETVEDWIDSIGLLSDSYKSIMDAWNYAFTSLFFGSNNLSVTKESAKKKTRGRPAVKKSTKTAKNTQ